jgi:hypothetical protein
MDVPHMAGDEYGYTSTGVHTIAGTASAANDGGTSFC